jgi:hypothetical protein
VLLGCAAMLAGLDVWLGPPRQALPDVVLLGALSVAPLALASVVVRTPGAATAACGAYLLPRSVLSLVDASIEPPPLLLVPSLAFELAAWLRPADLAWLRRRSRWQRRPPRVQRQLSARRTALGGASFGLVLGLVQRPFALLLGASPSAWPLDQTALAAVLASLACAGLCAAVYACMPRSIR